jgi:hypothetical protein
MSASTEACCSWPSALRLPVNVLAVTCQSTTSTHFAETHLDGVQMFPADVHVYPAEVQIPGSAKAAHSASVDAVVFEHEPAPMQFASVSEFSRSEFEQEPSLTQENCV